jgi:hypothetical protein
VTPISTYPSSPTSKTNQEGRTASINSGRTIGTGNSYASVAGTNLSEKTDAEKGFIRVTYPKRNQPAMETIPQNNTKAGFKMRKRILIGVKNQIPLNKPMETRDALNERMNEKLNLTKLMIAGIHYISRQNVVIVTNEGYTAQNLIDNTDIIRFIFECDRIQKDI